MSIDTDDGFIIESCPPASGTDHSERPRSFLVLASDEAEALQIVEGSAPGWDHRVTVSGQDIRAQAARLGIEPGTCRET